MVILGSHFSDGFIALLMGGRSSQSKDKYKFSIHYMLCILYKGYNIIRISCIYIACMF
jgi:hypothetical protein